MGSLPRSTAELYTRVPTATYKTIYDFRGKIKLTSTTLNVCKRISNLVAINNISKYNNSIRTAEYS